MRGAPRPLTMQHSLLSARMIFNQGGGVYGVPERHEPFMFPLAVPLLAGPSSDHGVNRTSTAPSPANSAR